MDEVPAQYGRDRGGARRSASPFFSRWRDLVIHTYYITYYYYIVAYAMAGEITLYGVIIIQAIQNIIILYYVGTTIGIW